MKQATQRMILALMTGILVISLVGCSENSNDAIAGAWTDTHNDAAGWGTIVYSRDGTWASKDDNRSGTFTATDKGDGILELVISNNTPHVMGADEIRWIEEESQLVEQLAATTFEVRLSGSFLNPTVSRFGIYADKETGKLMFPHATEGEIVESFFSLPSNRLYDDAHAGQNYDLVIDKTDLETAIKEAINGAQTKGEAFAQLGILQSGDFDQTTYEFTNEYGVVNIEFSLTPVVFDKAVYTKQLEGKSVMYVRIVGSTMQAWRDLEDARMGNDYYLWKAMRDN
jgi:hypothetical protein